MIVPSTPPVLSTVLVETLLVEEDEDVPGRTTAWVLVSGSSPRYLLIVVMTELTCI